MMKKICYIWLIILLCFGISGCKEEAMVVKESHKMNQKDVLEISDLIKMSFINDTISKSVEPKNPSGYYHYYEEKEGYFYFQVEGTIQNLSKDMLSTLGVATNVRIGEEVYAGQMVVIDEEGKEFKQEIKTEETLDFILFYLIPEVEKNKADSLELLFQKQWAKSTDSNSYDYRYLINLQK